MNTNFLNRCKNNLFLQHKKELPKLFFYLDLLLSTTLS